jgi:hypothetical protein
MIKSRLLALALVLFGAAADSEAGTQARPPATRDDCVNASARIFVAADEGEADEVGRLLKCGVDPNGEAKGMPLLVFAAHRGRVEVAGLLLDAGATRHNCGGENKEVGNKEVENDDNEQDDKE